MKRRKKQRASVPVSPKHKKRYIELAQKSISDKGRATIVQQEFRLPIAHSRQTVAGFYKENNIERKGSGRGRQVKVAVDIKKSDRHGVDATTYDSEIAELEGQRVTVDEKLSDLKLRREGLIALRELPQVKAERDKYKRGYENILGSLREDQLFRLAKQGNIPGLTLKDNKPNLTYHI